MGKFLNIEDSKEKYNLSGIDKSIHRKIMVLVWEDIQDTLDPNPRIYAQECDTFLINHSIESYQSMEGYLGSSLEICVVNLLLDGYSVEKIKEYLRIIKSVLTLAKSAQSEDEMNGYNDILVGILKKFKEGNINT